MKRNILYQFFILLGILTAGCSENGDDGFYDNQYRIYFPESVVHYDFGNKPVELTRYTVGVPVNIMGLPAVEGMKLKVKVNLEGTTARPEYYSTMPEEVVVEKGAVVAYIPVELIRKDIPSDIDTTFSIALTLEANEHFKLGIKESLEAEVTFSNYLGMPQWWPALAGGYIGAYHPFKYQKLIEIWGGEITFDIFRAQMSKVQGACKKMYDYFMAHPEYGMTFPNNIVWPYE